MSIIYHEIWERESNKIYDTFIQFKLFKQFTELLKMPFQFYDREILRRKSLFIDKLDD